MAKQTAPLDPDARSTLRDVLLPPHGFRLEHALATAYSLDAETLITIPLFAAGIDSEDLEKPLGIAKVYELGRRLTVLVQGDRIAISKKWAQSRALLRLVGDAVVPCSAGRGSFHPKLLVLQFTSMEEPDQSIYRVVVSTRNLTTDNSWDAVVVLDQDSAGETVKGLANTVSDLSRFVNNKKHPAVAVCKKMGVALSKVKFQKLPGVDALEVLLFHSGSGNADRVLQQIEGDDLLVISPFVRSPFIDDLAVRAGRDKAHRWLVTRPADVPDTAFANFKVLQIKNGALPTPERSNFDDAESNGESTDFRLSSRDSLGGLHAKIYLASSREKGTRVVITSANATPSGWNRNVEIAVSGSASPKAKAFQVKALVEGRKSSEDQRTFGDMLEEITPSAVVRTKEDPEWLRKARGVLAGSNASGLVTAGPPRTLHVQVIFKPDDESWPERVEVAAYLVGYPNYRGALTLNNGTLSGKLAIQPGIELVPFIVLKVMRAAEEPLEVTLALQLGGDLDWTPEDARTALALAAKPWLLRELLWHFGLKGSGTKRGTTGGTSPKPGLEDESIFPILEKVLLRVHGANRAAEVETIDNLLAGVMDDEEYRPLIEMWRLVKSSL